MSSLTDYKGLDVVTPDPTGTGGLAINNNFKKLSTNITTADPTASDDDTEGYGIGSRWYNSTTATEWICTDDTTGSAVWNEITANPFDQDLNTTNSPTFQQMFASGGSASSPAYSFSGDSNTGIYRGGTDTLNFSTAGNERLTILANGNVGIGTTTVGQKFVVAGTTGNVYGEIENTSITGDVAWRAKNNSGTIAAMGTFGSSSSAYGIVSANDSYIYSNNVLDILADSATGVIKFGTGQYGSTERMRITSTGNVGIGTTSPIARFSVKGEGTTTGVNFQTTNSSNAPLFTILDNGQVTLPGFLKASSGLLYANGFPLTDSDSILYTKTGSQLTNSSGNLSYGGGTTLADGSGLYYSDGDRLTNGGLLLYGDGVTKLADHGSLYYGGGGRLTSSGGSILYYGDGVTKLADSDPALYYGNGSKLASSGGNLFYSNGFKLADSDGKIYDGHSSNSILFGPSHLNLRGRWISNDGGDEGIRISDAGSVGIGTTTPTAYLHLAAGTAAAGKAPLKFTSGSLNTTAESGAVEFLTDKFYGTITTGAVRQTFAMLEAAQSFTATQIFSDVKLGTAGNGFYIKEGANATMGTVTLSGGTATINTSKITANSRVFVTIQSLGTVTAPQTIGVTARSAGTSFTISSVDSTDTSTVAWLILEPA